jgi:hypothetical protein
MKIQRKQKYQLEAMDGYQSQSEKQKVEAFISQAECYLDLIKKIIYATRNPSKPCNSSTLQADIRHAKFRRTHNP